MAPGFHVRYEDPFNTPTIQFAARCMPTFMQKKVMWGMQAPRARPLDVLEVLGEDPYLIDSIEEDKVWRVRYTYGGIDPKEYKQLGMHADEASQAKAEDVTQAEEDWERWMEYANVDVQEGLKGQYCHLCRSFLNMFIVKLASGGLLLHCPVVIHPDSTLDRLLQELGPVRYILIGSCQHTTHLPEVLRRFPDALVIGPSTAEGKLQTVSALPRKKLDFNYMAKDGLSAANAALAPEGVTLYVVEGDVFSQAVCAMAHDTLLEVDIVGWHHEGCTCTMCTSKEFATDPRYAVLRVFFRILFCKPNSPFGYLPAYRFAAMDPNSPLSSLNWPTPNPDGSSCTQMANALRGILKLPFKHVGSGHQFGHVSAEDFRRNVDAAWNWLDGSSLLPSAASAESTSE